MQKNPLQFARLMHFLQKEVEEQFQCTLIHQVLVAAVIIWHYIHDDPEQPGH